jgi:hypothetical protein
VWETTEKDDVGLMPGMINSRAYNKKLLMSPSLRCRGEKQKGRSSGMKSAVHNQDSEKSMNDSGQRRHYNVCWNEI